MSRASSDVFEEIEWAARYAKEQARKAEYHRAGDALARIRKYIEDAERLLNLEIKYRHEVESSRHD